jgi:hypothetical protein
LNRLSDLGDFRHIWALETLFSFLQSKASLISSPEGRESVRQEFFNEELPSVIEILVKDHDPRYECEPLKRLIEKDWEFRFILNYYLRDALYSKEPFSTVLQYIDKFLINNGQGRR